MPFYEYRCEKCGTKFELMRGIASRDEATRCTSCGAGGARRELPLVHASVRSAGAKERCGGNGAGFG
jgi:putative FmdB family regulatory protein